MYKSNTSINRIPNQIKTFFRPNPLIGRIKEVELFIVNLLFFDEND